MSMYNMSFCSVKNVKKNVKTNEHAVVVMHACLVTVQKPEKEAENIAFNSLSPYHNVRCVRVGLCVQFCVNRLCWIGLLNEFI